MIDVADVHTSTVRSKSGRRTPGRRAALRCRYRHVISIAQTVDEVPAQTAVTRDKQLTAASQGSATTQQIATAAGTLADLAGNLEATAATTRERY